MKLSLVIPCYNEEKNVRPFYEAASAVFNKAGYDYELVFVNDGSGDGTLAELKKLHAEADENIRIISFSRNFGKEAAMYAGLENTRGDYVCLIDADLQQRPEIAAEMVEILDAKPEVDCVAAFQEERSESAALRFFKAGFYKLINSVSDTEFMQGASDFRVFRRVVADSVLSLGEYHRFSKGLLSWVGFNVEFIPYKAEQRAAGESKWSFKKLFKYAVEGVMAFSTAPLLLPLIGGGLLTAAAVIGLIIRAIVAGVKGVPFGWGAGVLLAVLFCSGLILCGVGIAAVYLSKVYEQSKDRPIYIAKEIIEPKSKDE